MRDLEIYTEIIEQDALDQINTLRQLLGYK